MSTPGQAPLQSIDQLRSAFRGDLIQSGDAGYDAARRLYNAMIDKHPQLIARCVDVADVIAAVRYGVENKLLTAVRGGGHNGAGLASCDGGLVIDLSRMKGIRVNPPEKTVRVEAGCVWGDVDHATEFLHELQEVDWRRYGQSGRSKQLLAQMRHRLEKEQGSGNILKAGGGGYYDIDFALMYLRLKSAGIFYKVLNTPARIDVVEKMGHLERADADFLRDAATFYRAVDHALRVSTGQSEGSLPKAQSQLQNLTELVSRWTPAHLHDQPLDIELSQIQNRTREFFDRLFVS